MKRLGRLALATVGLVVLAIAAPIIVGRVFGLDGYMVERPLRGSQVDIGEGRSLNVFDAGSGPLVILIHGLPGGAAQMGPLADQLTGLGYRTVRYDRLGFGRSSARGGKPHTLEQNARDLLALMDALGEKSAVLAGYSFGGGVVQEVARLAPERITAAALISSIGPTRPVRQASQNAAAKTVRETLLFWALSIRPTAEFFAGSSFVALFSPEPVARPDMDAMLATLAKGDSVNTWMREGEGVQTGAGQLKPELLRVPVVVIHGEEDAMVAISVGEQVADAIEGAHFERIAGVGHALPMTHPARIATLIDELVKPMAGGV